MEDPASLNGMLLVAPKNKFQILQIRLCGQWARNFLVQIQVWRQNFVLRYQFSLPTNLAGLKLFKRLFKFCHKPHLFIDSKMFEPKKLVFGIRNHISMLLLRRKRDHYNTSFFTNSMLLLFSLSKID